MMLYRHHHHLHDLIINIIINTIYIVLYSIVYTIQGLVIDIFLLKSLIIKNIIIISAIKINCSSKICAHAGDMFINQSLDCNVILGQNDYLSVGHSSGIVGGKGR